MTVHRVIVYETVDQIRLIRDIAEADDPGVLRRYVKRGGHVVGQNNVTEIKFTSYEEGPKS